MFHYRIILFKRKVPTYLVQQAFCQLLPVLNGCLRRIIPGLDFFIQDSHCTIENFLITKAPSMLNAYFEIITENGAWYDLGKIIISILGRDKR